MRNTTKIWTGVGIVLIGGGLLAVFAGGGPGGVNRGVSYASIPPSPLDPRSSITAVMLYAPPRLKPKFELYSTPREKPLEWARLWGKKGITEAVTVVIDAELPQSDGDEGVKLRSLNLHYPSQKNDNVGKYVREVLQTWTYTPFARGPITFTLDVGAYNFAVDISRLKIVGDYDTVPVGELWRIPDAESLDVILPPGPIQPIRAK